jgi:hypothetical protein
VTNAKVEQLLQKVYDQKKVIQKEANDKPA